MYYKGEGLIYMGCKRDLRKNDKTFSIYNVFDPVAQESAGLFASQSDLDLGITPMDTVDILVDIRGNFVNLKKMELCHA